jgi:hypothetical protein
MAATTPLPRHRQHCRHEVHKPTGTVHSRVQKVGPERFGIGSVEGAKARSKWMLANFYGQILIPPTEVAHSKNGFDSALHRLRQACADRPLLDLLVAVERTGLYHLTDKDAFAAAGFEVRTMHPFATKQFRQPAHPGIKTDDTDLAAIPRAAVNGLGLIELPLDPPFGPLRLLVRNRRDLVPKTSALRCQIRDHLGAHTP